MRKRVSRMPRGNMGSDFRMPIKRGGFGGGFGGSLREAIRRLQEQRGGNMGMPRAPQPIPERMPTDPSSYFNPTIFGQPIPQGADFSNMPDFSQIDMSQLNIPTLPQEISQMNLPQMPEGLPSMEEIQGNRRMPEMDRGRMQPRMRMAEGDEVFMPSNPNQLAFSIGVEINNLYKDYEEAVRGGDDQRAMMLNEEINDLEARRIKMMNEAKAMEQPQGMMYGGEMKGYADGGEIEAMLGGMDSGEQEAMGELEQMAPEMEMIDQLVNMVVQMIQQGAGEQQVISFLREQGLDDEDIGTVFQLVAEMSETEEMAEDQIGNELAQLS